MSGKGWPLNYHLTFDLLAVGSVGAIALCLLLPASIEKKRENRTQTEAVPSAADLGENDKPRDDATTL